MPLSEKDQAFNEGIDAAVKYHTDRQKKFEEAQRALTGSPDDDYSPKRYMSILGGLASEHRMIANDLYRMRRLSPEEIAQRAADEQADIDRENS